MPQVIVGNLLRKPLHKFRALRARTDKSHVSAEYVPELRNLIEASLAHESAERGDANVVLGRPHGSVCLSIHSHRAKFVNGKRTALAPDTYLSKKDRPRRRKVHSQDNEWNTRQGYRKADSCHDDGDKPLSNL